MFHLFLRSGPTIFFANQLKFFVYTTMTRKCMVMHLLKYMMVVDSIIMHQHFNIPQPYTIIMVCQRNQTFSDNQASAE